MSRAAPWLGRGVPATIRVLLTTPESLLGEALATYLDDQDGIEVVGLTFDTSLLTEAVDVLRPTVLVIDHRSAVRLAPVLDECRATLDTLRTVLLSSTARPLPGDVDAADAVVPPASSLDRVVAAVREVAWHRAAEPAGATPQLSDRELEVLRLLARGQGTDDIAGALHLSPHTVRNHIRRLGSKLGTHSRVEAVSAARRHGLV